MTQKKTCPICLKDFDMTKGNIVYDTLRCAYIGKYIKRPQAIKMGREAAIEHYGARFDDPLRSIGYSKYMPHLRHIYNYCIDHQKTTFTAEEIAEGFDGKLDYYVLGAIGRVHHVMHISGEREINGAGTRHVSVWKFVLPDNKEITELQS